MATCKMCPDGSWECGEPSSLCRSSDTLYLNQAWCHDVWVKEDPHGKCMVRIRHTNEGSPGGAWEKYGTICYDVYTKKDNDGRCVVVIDPRDQKVNSLLAYIHYLKMGDISTVQAAIERQREALERYGEAPDPESEA